MSEFDNLKFTDEQKTFFNKRLKEELEAAGHRSQHIAATPEEKAVLAFENNDLRALDDLHVRGAFLRKYGQDAFGRLHLRFTRAEREKSQQAERERLLAGRRVTQGRRVF